jgi:DNA-binding SARP family transcriptional activator
MQTVPSIHLLGRPWLARDGDLTHAPRGRKVWGLLAYLVMATQPHSRDHLASLLFAEADDPLGALRWNLAELRRSLGLADLLRGERISLSLPEGTYVDVQVVTSASWIKAAAVPGLGSELLAGMDFATSPGFEAWLLNERRRLAVVSLAALREGAMARLAAGDAVGAQSLAARMVTLAREVDRVAPTQTLGLREIGCRSDQTLADIEEMERFDECSRLPLRFTMLVGGQPPSPMRCGQRRSSLDDDQTHRRQNVSCVPDHRGHIGAHLLDDELQERRRVDVST